MDHLATVLPMERKKPGPKPTKKTRLGDWLHSNWTGDNKALAETLGISISHLEKLIHGRELPGVTLALEIKRLTHGALDLDQLCDPDLAYQQVA